MTTAPVRLAMLGCGCAADLYMPVFAHLVEGRLEAVVDIDRAAAEGLARRYYAPKVYTDVRAAAADPAIDAFIIGTPPNWHAEHTELAAAAGKHVLCEKPMAATVVDCQRMIDACHKRGVKLQMGHMKRFMRGNQKVKAIVDSGVLGKIFMVECHWDCGVPGLVSSYREKEATAGGSLQDHGPHSFDLVRWWTGNDILEVSASMRSVHPGRPAEDAVISVLEHENGMFSYHHMTRISYGREHTQDAYRLYGTNGTLVVRNDHHFPTTSLESPEIILYAPGGIIHRYEVWNGWNQDDTIRQSYAFYNQTRAFCECILNDSEPLVTGEDSMHTMQAVLAAYVSSWRGIKVKLPFTEEVDLRQLFREVKARDRATLGEGYTVAEPQTVWPDLPDPLFGHRPPRTKEHWDYAKHGAMDSARRVSLSGRLEDK